MVGYQSSESRYDLPFAHNGGSKIQMHTKEKLRDRRVVPSGEYDKDIDKQPSDDTSRNFDPCFLFHLRNFD